MTKQALEDVRVVDWTLHFLGPSAAAVLAENGADVIHLEDTIHGDACRGVSASMGTSLLMPNGKSAWFETLNRNKRSLAVDLKKPEGREIVYRLVEKSDIFLTNYRVKARRKLGLDYEALRKRNPKIVYGSATAFGEKGPAAEAPGVELVGFAAAGTMMASGEEGSPPMYFSSGFGDCTTGYILAYSLMAALHARDRLGVGQEVKTSLLGGLTGVQRALIDTYLLAGNQINRHNRNKEPNPLWNWYRCSEGRWLAFADVRPQSWAPFCRVLGVPWVLTDPRFEEEPKRQANAAELIAIVDEAMAKRTANEWEKAFREQDITCSMVNAVADLANDEQMMANDYIIDWEHPELGKVKAVGYPVSFSETPPIPRGPAPQETGQHTDEILSETLGYSWQEIAALKDLGVIL